MRISPKIFLFLFCTVISINLLSQSVQYSYHDDVEKIIASKILNEEISYMVSMPAEYEEKQYLKYPLLLVLDAGDHFQGIKTILNYYWGNYLPKMILVGLKSNHNRAAYFTSFVDSNVVNKTALFTRFLIEEFIPMVQLNYPAIDHSTIIGHSHAGLYTLHLALSQKSIFNNFISIDPSLYLLAENSKVVSLSTLDPEILNGKSLYIGMGGPLDRDDDSISIAEVIQSNSPSSLLARRILQLCLTLQSIEPAHFNFTWKYYPDDIHGTVPLPASIDGLRFLFSWYQLKSASIINNPESSLDAVKKALNERSMRFNKNFAHDFPIADEEMFSMGAQMFMQMDQKEKAALFYNSWIENYPDNPNAVLELANFYLENGNKDKAINILKKSNRVLENKKISEKIALLTKE